MPARDGTGPLGQGARTGRGMGNCSPNQQYLTRPTLPTGYANPLGWFGRMWGNTFGGGRGRGRRNRTFWR